MSEIRLSCNYCDREDFDGINEIPADWDNVEFVRTQAENEADEEDSSWWTHIGTCPDCAAAEQSETILAKLETLTVEVSRLQAENARMRKQVEQLAELVREAMDYWVSPHHVARFKQRLDAIVGGEGEQNG